MDVLEDPVAGGTTACFYYETAYVVHSGTGDTITVVELVCYWSDYKWTRYGSEAHQRPARRRANLTSRHASLV